jgi:arylsulfatase A-like enzyme
MPGSSSAPFASPMFKGKSQNGPWGDSIEELDWSTGQILEKLVELKLDKNTLVIWTSDNGSPLAADASSLSRGSNGPLYGRGYTTAEGAFRVPMIAWWPGRIPPGTTCEELTTTMDCLPTLAALAGTHPPNDRIIDGHDIRPLLFGEAHAKTPYEAFYYYQMDQLQAVRKGPWKLFLPLESFQRHPHFKKGQSDKPLLFNVVTDVGSKRNVAGEHPEVVKELTELAENARSDLGDAGRPGQNQRPPGMVENPKPRRKIPL